MACIGVYTHENRDDQNDLLLAFEAADYLVFCNVFQ